jgi:predicted PurR-regulated permease PerM
MVMSRLGGISAALLAAFVALSIGGPAAANLPAPRPVLVLSSLVAVAAVIGYVAGSAVCRRALRGSTQVTTFAGLAGGVAGGLIGSICAVTLTGFYFASYLQWPSDRFQQALLVLAYPASALLGMCIGAIPGLIHGVLGGGVLRIVTLRR